MKVRYIFFQTIIIVVFIIFTTVILIPRPSNRAKYIEHIPTVAHVNYWNISDDDDLLSGAIDISVTLKNGRTLSLRGVDFDSKGVLQFKLFDNFDDFDIMLWGNPDQLPSSDSLTPMQSIYRPLDGLSMIDEFRKIVDNRSVNDLLTRSDDVSKIIDRIPIMNKNPSDFTGDWKKTRVYFESIPKSFPIQIDGVEYKIFRYKSLDD